ncbi:MAG: YdeI/OmpD-associated family protein [Rhodothermales bacterium]
MPSPSNEPFATQVTRQASGFHFHCLLIPPEIADSYTSRGIRRVIATINGCPFRRAIQRNANGESLVIVGASMLREVRATFGDVVIVELAPDPEPDRIDLGDELTEVLEMDEEAAARFYSFSPGKQRSLAYHVTSAKREETRIKRALEIAHKLRTYTLYGDLPREE